MVAYNFGFIFSNYILKQKRHFSCVFQPRESEENRSQLFFPLYTRNFARNVSTLF